MKKYHKKLMGLSETTDVLSVSQIENRKGGDLPNFLNSIGDVIVCVPEAKRQAQQAGCSPREEIGRYLIHGILHCVGYDDLSPQKRKTMWRLQEHLLSRHKRSLGLNKLLATRY
jgi:probable rRNA maturation factor